MQCCVICRSCSSYCAQSKCSLCSPLDSALCLQVPFWLCMPCNETILLRTISLFYIFICLVINEMDWNTHRDRTQDTMPTSARPLVGQRFHWRLAGIWLYSYCRELSSGPSIGLIAPIPPIRQYMLPVIAKLIALIYRSILYATCSKPHLTPSPTFVCPNNNPCKGTFLD